MSGYAGADPVVEGCLSGPVSSGTTETWVQYRSANPDFRGGCDWIGKRSRIYGCDKYL